MEDFDLSRTFGSLSNPVVTGGRELGVDAEKKSVYNSEIIDKFSDLASGSRKSIDNFKRYFLNTPMRIPTGVDFVDDVTNGGLYNGITVIAGVPGIGKTSMLVQIGVEMSSQGYPVVYISKDMTSHEIMLKALCFVSGRYCDEGVDINTLGEVIREGKLSDNLADKYIQICRNFTILDFRIEANREFISLADSVLNSGYKGDEDDSVQTVSYLASIFEVYCNLYKKPPLFIIDSLQSLALYSSTTGKEGVDSVLSQIKYLQMNFGVPVLLVSNLNRNSYRKRIEIDSLKESGNIEYDASAILALDTCEDLDDFREDERRRVTIKNLKDRASGYRECEVIFDVKCGRFSYESTEIPCMQAVVSQSNRVESGQAQPHIFAGVNLDTIDMKSL